MLAGSLTEFGLADVFALLASTRKTGVLNLESADVGGRVWIASGGLCYAVADVTRSPLAARLLHTGQVNGHQAEEIIAAQASGEAAAVGDTLSAFGMTTDEIRSLLRAQIVDAVFDLSRWDGGTFAFDQGSATDVVPVAVAEEVLAEVAQRLEGWEAIEARIPEPTSVLTLVTRPASAGPQVAVDLEHWGVLTLVDGLRPVQEVIDLSGLGRHGVSRMLGDLLEQGLVEVRDLDAAETATQERQRILSVAEQHLLGARTSRPAPAPDLAGTSHPRPEPVLPAVAQPTAPLSGAPSAATATGSEIVDDGLVVSDPAGEDPVVQVPVVHEAVADLGVDVTGVDVTGVDVTGDEASVVEASGDEASAADVYAADAAAGEGPAGGEPSVEEPSVEEPGVQDLRAQALAELGLVGTPATRGEATDGPRADDTDADGPGNPGPGQHLARDRTVDADLVSRLIDGISGA